MTNMEVLRPVKSKIQSDTLIISTEFGYDIHYKIIPSVMINPLLEENGMPFFSTDIKFEYIKTEKTKQALSKNKTLKAISKRSILPENIGWQRIFLGFVYADQTDPNNHKWWIDLRDPNNNGIYNIYSEEMVINCPFTTTSWFANEYHHGRFVFYQDDVKDVLFNNGKITIRGKKKQIKTDLTKVCSPQEIPEDVTKLRLRYNINNDMWFCDFLDSKGKEVNTLGVKSILCDAPAIGTIMSVGDKPKVSIIINTKDIANIGIEINSLLIRGK